MDYNVKEDVFICHKCGKPFWGIECTHCGTQGTRMQTHAFHAANNKKSRDPLSVGVFFVIVILIVLLQSSCSRANSLLEENKELRAGLSEDSSSSIINRDWNDGHTAGYYEGYDEGYADAEKEAEARFYDRGYEDGYHHGYEDGWNHHKEGHEYVGDGFEI